jgi:hypothetical protein
MGLGTLTLMGMLMAPGQASPDVVHPFNQAKMDIPISYDPAKKGEIRDLILYVSRNRNESWEQYAVAKPDADTFFTFNAAADGEYWFQMMIVDRQGRRDPPDLRRGTKILKVLIDTKSPLVTIRSVDRVGDEVTVSWDVQEANPDWTKFSVEYRTADGVWTPAEAKGNLSCSAKFHVAQSGPLTVRVQAYDTAGNRAEATKDVVAPARVVAAVGTTNPNTNTQQAAMRVNVPELTPGVGDPTGSPLVVPPADPLRSAPMGPVSPPPAVDPLLKSDPAGPGSPLAVSPSTPAPASGVPLPAAQVINVARFDLAYDVDQKGPSGVSKAEIWVTRDEGRKWERWSTTEKTESPITVDLATRNNAQVEGTYGLKIVLLSGAGLSKGPPVSGDAPDMRVDVDLTPPVVKIYEPVPDPNSKDTMLLRWQAVDRNLANDPITLEWAEQPDGPWNPVAANDSGTGGSGAAKRLANSGQYAWHLPSSFPTHRVYLKVTARDTAGNIAEARTPHPILVDMNKPVARIQGIIGATPEKR